MNGLRSAGAVGGRGAQQAGCGGGAGQPLRSSRNAPPGAAPPVVGEKRLSAVKCAVTFAGAPGAARVRKRCGRALDSGATVGWIGWFDGGRVRRPTAMAFKTTWTACQRPVQALEAATTPARPDRSRRGRSVARRPSCIFKRVSTVGDGRQWALAHLAALATCLGSEKAAGERRWPGDSAQTACGMA